MSMRIGFDMDGVLADMNAAVDREATALFGALETPTAEAATEDAAETKDDGPEPELGRQLTRRQQKQLWKRISQIENFWNGLEETEPGIVARLWSLAQARRWEVIFLTKRPETAGLISQLQSYEWLVRHGYACPSVFVVQGSRGKIAAALHLDLVVDDTPDNCVDVLAESKAKAILVARTADARIGPSARHLGIGVVSSVSECLDLLANESAGGKQPVHFVARVLQMLGIAPPAARNTRPLADF